MITVTDRVCSECTKRVSKAVEFGHAAYQTERCVICLDCLQKALSVDHYPTWTVVYPRTSNSPRTTKAREEAPPVYGHEYAGTVRKVAYNGHDTDGDEHWYPAMNEYDPATCVVCGMRTEKVSDRIAVWIKNPEKIRSISSSLTQVDSPEKKENS